MGELLIDILIDYFKTEELKEKGEMQPYCSSLPYYDTDFTIKFFMYICCNFYLSLFLFFLIKDNPPKPLIIAI